MHRLPNPWKRKSGILLALLALLGVSAVSTVERAAPAAAASCPVNVANYGHTLAAAQKALNALTSTCRTIVFPAGTYQFNDQFRIGSGSVTISGQPGAVIVPASGASWRGGMIQIAAPNVTVTGLTIANSRDKGIETNRSAKGFTISRNSIHHSHTMGIHVLRSSSGTISGNSIYSNTSNGIDLHGATNITISGNKAYLNGGVRFPDRNEGNGILVYCSQRVNVLSNTVWNNSQKQPGSRDGIRLSDNDQENGEMPTRYVRVEDNLIYDNQSSGTQDYAVRVGGPAAGRTGGDLNYITVKNNRGYGNLHSGVYTEGLIRGATATITNNSLSGR